MTSQFLLVTSRMKLHLLLMWMLQHVLQFQFVLMPVYRLMIFVLMILQYMWRRCAWEEWEASTSVETVGSGITVLGVLQSSFPRHRGCIEARMDV
jgi:hypothetical protein